MNLRAYVMRYFGIELEKPGLTDDERTLLESIRTHQDEQITDEGFVVDEEFSILCSQQLA